MRARMARRSAAILGLLLGLCLADALPQHALLAAKDPCSGRRDVAIAATADAATQRTVLAVACATAGVRGLIARTPIIVRLVDGATLSATVKAIMRRDEASRPTASTTAALGLLGALNPGDDLAAIDGSGYSLSTAAQYSTSDKTLYVRAANGKFSLLDLAVLSHEYVRALLDQYFNLQSLLNDSGSTRTFNSDARLARQAVVEGDAFATMLAYANATFDRHQLFQFNQQLQRSTGNSPNDYAHDRLGFPATQGTTFINTIKTAAAQGKRTSADRQAAGNAAANQVLRDPPDSTAEVLHPDLYLAHRADPAQAVSVPEVDLGAAWSEQQSDVMGAFGIGDLLIQHGLTHGQIAQAAQQAASRWLGDRWVVYQHGSDTMLIWRARFISAADAQSFVNAFAGYTGSRFHTTIAPGARLDWHADRYAMSVRQRGADIVVAIGSSKDLLTETGEAVTLLGFP